MSRIAELFPDGRRSTLAEVKTLLPGVGRLDWTRPMVEGRRVTAAALAEDLRFELRTVTGFNEPPTEAELAGAANLWVEVRALLLQ